MWLPQSIPWFPFDILMGIRSLLSLFDDLQALSEMKSICIVSLSHIAPLRYAYYNLYNRRIVVFGSIPWAVPDGKRLKGPEASELPRSVDMCRDCYLQGPIRARSPSCLENVRYSWREGSDIRLFLQGEGLLPFSLFVLGCTYLILHRLPPARVLHAPTIGSRLYTGGR